MDKVAHGLEHRPVHSRARGRLGLRFPDGFRLASRVRPVLFRRADKNYVLWLKVGIRTGRATGPGLGTGQMKQARSGPALCSISVAGCSHGALTTARSSKRFWPRRFLKFPLSHFIDVSAQFLTKSAHDAYPPLRCHPLTSCTLSFNLAQTTAAVAS